MEFAAIARARRLARLFSDPSNRALIVAWAHGPLLGPIPGTEASELDRIAPQLSGADGLLISPSHVEAVHSITSARSSPSLFILQQWQNISRPQSLRGYDEGTTAALISVDDAAAAGADGVMTYLYIGWRDPHVEAEQVDYVREVSSACRRLGILHMVEPRVVTDELDDEGYAAGELVRYHTRLSAELGADIIKIKQPELVVLRQVVSETPVPILVAGGARSQSFDAKLRDARAISAAGAAGLVWGRNIYQHADPALAIKELQTQIRIGNADD
ncbi:MAG: hypothetical protein M3132_09970 [Actinomycetia bacterium]|nr:hypothetical protein [Actinomycetes bacterium]